MFNPLPCPLSHIVCLALAASACCLAQNPPPAQPPANPVRTWTSVNGNTIEGAFVKEEEGKVYLLRPDGSTIATTRAKLSPNDLAWIDKRSNPDD